MALADFDAYKSFLAGSRPALYLKSPGTMDTNTWASFWLFNSLPAGPAAPTTAVACSRSTSGAIAGPISSTLAWHITEVWMDHQVSDRPRRSGMIIDRLSHQGGLSGTVTTEQTTNLPTAALTRYTSGVGVMIGIHTHTAIGATIQTVTANYTNQAGTSGRTTIAVDYGGGAGEYARAGTFRILPLQDGDTGARSVEGVTLSGSTGTAGAFGVCLFKPILCFTFGAIESYHFNQSPALRGFAFPEVDDDACLDILIHGGSSAATPGVQGHLLLGQL